MNVEDGIDGGLTVGPRSIQRPELSRFRGVRWSDLDPGRYEEMVAVLLCRLHPDSQHVDGRGGDGGRDVWFDGPGGREIFELKSFAGRLHSSRRRQVERSLRRAAEHQPVVWHLLVPIDPTPAEGRWFEALARTVPFECKWHGRTWLDAHIGDHPSVVRYFCHGGADEVMELLRELRQEEAALGRGVPDALERLRRLTARVNELDPYYRFGLADDGNGQITVSLHESFPGAARERPITVSGVLRFPDTSAGQEAARAFEEAMTFGTAVALDASYVASFNIDAPAGLGGTFEGGELRLGANIVQSPPDVTFYVVAQDPNGVDLASLPLVLGERTVGPGGGLQAEAADPSGVLQFRLRFVSGTGRFQANYRYAPPPHCLPGSVLPAILFLKHYHSPNHIVFRLGPTDDLSGSAAIDDPEPPVAEGYTRIVEALARVQGHTQTYFDLPEEITENDATVLAELDELLAGRTVRGHWRATSASLRAGDAQQMLTEAGISVDDQAGVHLWMTQPERFELCGHHITLQVTSHLKSVLFENLTEILALAASNPEASTELRIVPGSTDEYEMKRTEQAA